MGRIYTRTGDKGMTGIHGGIRVPKTDIRIEANGSMDEFNVAVGNIRVYLAPDHEWQEILKKIQMDLMTAMSLIATGKEMLADNPNKLSSEVVDAIEKKIDEISEKCTPSVGFILPGGTALSVAIHQARVLARKAERRLWELNAQDEVPELILRYLNRLSDLFFIMARYALLSQGKEEEIWKKFGYKKHS